MATNLVPWGLLLVIAVVAGCLVYIQQAAVKRARADAQRAEAGLSVRSARLATLIERLQANSAQDATQAAGLYATETGPFSEEEIRLAGLFADQATRAQENARLLEQAETQLTAGSAQLAALIERLQASSAQDATQTASLYSAEAGPFAEQEFRLAGLFADRAAVAAEKARLLEQAQWELAERDRVEENLRYRAAFERLAVNLAARFTALPPAEVDDGINQGLADIGGFAGADRVYVYLLAAAGTTIDNTHEWCTEGVESQMASAQDIPTDSWPWWMASLRRSETIHVPHVSMLPPEASAEREILERRGVRSVVAVPMMLDRELVGFLGFDSVREAKTWPEEDIALLGILAGIIVNALERADTVWTTW